MIRPVALLTLFIAALGPGRVASAQQAEAPPRRVTAAGTHRSPEAARRLAVTWHDAILPAVKRKRPDPIPATAPPPRDRLPLEVFRKQVRGKRLRPRPALIHVFDPNFKMGELLRLERTLFSTEPLLIAAGFFDNFRLKEGSGLPAGFWVTDANGRVRGRMALNASRREVEAALARVFGSHYEGTLAAAVAKYAAWLDRLEEAEDAVARNRGPDRAVALVRIRRGEQEVLPRPRKQPVRARKTEPGPRKPGAGESAPGR